MRIVRVTVVNGNAHVEVEGLDLPVVVTEGKTLSLNLQAVSGGSLESVRYTWAEEHGVVIAQGPLLP